MSWVAFGIATLVVYVLQASVVGYFHWWWADLFLVLAIVWALGAHATDGRLAGWIAGFVQDLGSTGPIGINAFALGLTAFLVVWLRTVFNVQVAWIRFLIALAAAVPGQWLVLWFAGGPHFGWMSTLARALTIACVAAVLATLLTILPGLAVRRRRRPRIA